jgi:class 3 adenylate cyclase/tetratricopeptide (TPR) repeat protein
MECPKCRFENPEGIKFCGECGGKLEIRCSKCNSSNPPQFKFCGECGNALTQAAPPFPVNYEQPHSYTPKHLADKILTTRSAIEGERKLVTVLFADVAGFTAISEKLDAEQVHDVMDGCFRILMDEIHRFEGTINQFTGDGVMAIFGAPVAHEEHAQRACHAALAIQTAIEPYSEKLKTNLGIEFRIRIGINSGPVVVGSIGDDLRMDYTAQGDTSNLASRMESHAEPGTALISEGTYKLVKDFFEFVSKEKLQVKGKEMPVEAYRLVGLGEVATRIGASAAKGLTHFVGRTPEIGALKEAFTKARSGQGQVVGIVGEAGVGKSRLLLELRNVLPKREYTYLEGHCLHYGDSMPYLPILDILRSYIGIKEGERESVINEKMNDRILGLDENLNTAIPPFQELLSLKTDDQEYSRLEPKQKREKTFESIRDLLVRSSQERPLILVIEDLHWIDKTSEEFLKYMLGSIPNNHILIILLYRPEYTHPWGSKSYHSKIWVDQLSDDTSLDLLQAILDGGDVIPELRSLILNRASGNPFFVEELTHSLLENGSILKKEGQYVLITKPSDNQIPDTIQGIVAARMDRLEEGLKRIMQVAAVIGREFAFQILHAVIDIKEDLKSNLSNLQELEFIYEKSLFPELEYIFKHALSQETAYNSLLVKKRKEIHGKIGKAIEDVYPLDRMEEFYEVLAYHYSKSDCLEKAWQYSKLSGEKAERNYSHREAFNFYRETVKLLNKSPETYENKKEKNKLLHLLISPMGILGWPEGSIDILREGEGISKELGDSRRLAGFYSAMGMFYSHGGEPHLGIRYSEDAFEEARKNHDTKLMVGAAFTLFISYASVGDYYKIVDIAPSVIDLIEGTERQNDFFSVAINPYSLSCSFYAYCMGNLGIFEEGENYLRKGLRNASEINELMTLGMVELHYGWYFIAKGNWEAAKEHLQNSIRYSEDAKYNLASAISWSELGYSFAMLGDTEIGRRYAEKGLKIHGDIGVKMFFSLPHYRLGSIQLKLGALKNARSLTEEALTLSQENNEKSIEGRSWILLGRILGKQNPSLIYNAEDCIQKGIDILQGLKARAFYSPGYLSLGELYLDAGEKEKALENIKKAESMFQKMGMNYWIRKTREILSVL